MSTTTSRVLLGAAAAAALVSLTLAQPGQRAQPPQSAVQSLPPANGPRRADPAWHALRNATVHPRPGEAMEHATVVMRDGVITAVLPGEPGPDGKPGTADDVPARVPIGPRVWECDGLHIYAGFIDPYVEVEAPAPDPTSPGLHWNSKVTPQRKATDGSGISDAAAKDLRAQGFTAAAIAPQGGLFKGQSAVVSLASPSGDPSKARPPVYRDGVYQSVTLNARSGFGGGGSREEGEQGKWTGYPGSQMGAIALIRQTLIDADWQAQSRAAGVAMDVNAVDSLSASPSSGKAQQPLLFDSSDELEALRAAKIAAEFDRTMILLGSGMEFRRMPAIVEACSGASGSGSVASTPVILPLSFPRPPDVTSISAAEGVELRDMMTWEQAPANPRRLDDAGLTVALTTAKLRSTSDFRKSLQRAMRYGLAPDRALAMVTTAPASLLGVEAVMGTIESGKLANLIVADGDLFTPEKAPKKRPDEKNDTDKKGDKDDDEPSEPSGAGRRPDSDGADTNSDDFDQENRAGLAQPAGGRGRSGIRGGRSGAGRRSGGDAEEEKIVQIRDVWIDGQRHEINAAPEPDITGTYDITSEPPTPGAAQIIIEKDDAITIKMGDATAKARSVARVKSRLNFVFDHDSFGEKGVASVSAVVEGDTIFGTGFNPAGEKVTFTAVKQPPSGAIGVWRIIENDGQATDPAGEKQLVITITGGASPKLSLDFTRIGGKHVVIESSDVQLRAKGATFSHSLKDLGVDATSKDTITIDGDILTGESTLSDESKHTYQARREPARSPSGPSEGVAEPSRPGEARTPAPTIQGIYLITLIDDKPNAKPGAKPNAFIFVKGENSIALRQGGQSFSAEDVSVRGKTIKYAIDFAKVGGSGKVTSEATLSDDGKTLNGSMVVPDGTTHKWTAERRPGDPDTLADLTESSAMPFGPYAKDTLPAMPKYVSIDDATIWTSGPDGILRPEEGGTRLVINSGKIVYVGKAVPYTAPPDEPGHPGQVLVINAKGKHITAGLIDCHSHTGISRGVNEGGQAVTAEVRIQDVTNPDAIGWYRELAGGLTTVNSLHGSANPIGGQNCVNKIRWGVPHPDDMHFAGRFPAPGTGAKPGIKFALGENVKQSNGDRASTRYPVTRMGVESLMRDRFVTAREYVAAWTAWTNRVGARADEIERDIKAGKRKDPREPEPSMNLKETFSPSAWFGRSLGQNVSLYFIAAAELGEPEPHRDLELEALAEVLEGKRLVHCHSYRQDEILMLARLSREFGFKLGTYQHNLEGYKVADAVKDSSIGASLFSDWWAYKVEVQDAIPYAGPIMHDVGVVVSYNSDSDELARRMNTEAAKAVTYGGLSPEEALKFVTINPAKQLAIDSRVGSLEPGKDADFVIWSGPPLSQFSVCESTWIDGREYFSREQDKKDREHIAMERTRLIQKILASGESAEEGGGGGPDSRPGDEVITVSGDCGCGSLHW